MLLRAQESSRRRGPQRAVARVGVGESVASGARNARLLMGLAPHDAGRAVPGVLLPGHVPSRLLRAGQRLRVKMGRLDWEQAWLEPLVQARREHLGGRASGPPRLLVRVDEFPNAGAFYDEATAGLDASRRFHEIMIEAGVNYLTAVLPEPALDALNPDSSATRPLEPGEVDLIEELRVAGVSFAQHGTTHRTRHTSPRRRSELIGLSDHELRELLDRGRTTLTELGIEPRVFVPPFNRFTADQYGVLADRFDVVCGGPESIALVGFHGGPLWHGDAVYMPCYHPLYSSAAEVLPAVERLIDMAPGTWIPIVLHSGWEAGGSFASLQQLARRIAPYSVSWETFLSEVDQSRATGLAAGAGPPVTRCL